MRQVRQGDVLLREVSQKEYDAALNAAEKKKRRVARDGGRVILAYGEVTGHAHAVKDDEGTEAAELIQLQGGERFLFTNGGISIVHEEHGAIPLPAPDESKGETGIFQVVRQREYEAPEVNRFVAD